MPPSDGRPLRILHVFRAPVGGLFRHVLDLSRGQITRGHQVGLILDSSAAELRAERALSEVAPSLGLGMSRVAMSRHAGWSDFTAARHVARRIRELAPDIVHGHGAKGGAYVRLLRAPARVYTPHGGSLHFDPRSPLGLAYLTVERMLAHRTELFLFESAFARDAFAAKIGRVPPTARVVHNGVSASEFVPIEPHSDAADFVFIGELRTLKGIEVLIDAVGKLASSGRNPRTVIVGSGPEAEAFAAKVQARGLSHSVRLESPLPARDAFRLGRVLVVPSLAESLPYVVLEAAAAGTPVIATNVGGIPEIFGPHRGILLPAGDASALATAMSRALDDPEATRRIGGELRERVRQAFSADVMVDQVLAAYRRVLDPRAPSGPAQLSFP